MKPMIVITTLFWMTTAYAERAMSEKPAPSASSAPAANQSSSPNGVVNLMTASEEELMRLPGIGPAKAHAIVELRKTHPFKKTEDIVRVKGIGRKTFQRLKPYLAITGQTTLVKDVPSITGFNRAKTTDKEE